MERLPKANETLLTTDHGATKGTSFNSFYLITNCFCMHIDKVNKRMRSDSNIEKTSAGTNVYPTNPTLENAASSAIAPKIEFKDKI